MSDGPPLVGPDMGPGHPYGKPECMKRGQYLRDNTYVDAILVRVRRSGCVEGSPEMYCTP
jgi:hypothetical protein